MAINKLEKIYGRAADEQRARFEKAKQKFERIFGEPSQRYFSASGRSEVGGNHTDHNCGRVLACAVSLDVIACVTKRDDNIIRIKSEGFPEDEIDISVLEPDESEVNSSAALIRGVAAAFTRMGYKAGGFNAYTTSNVMKGSGISSSAAFEVLVGNILNSLYNDGEIDAVKIAMASQTAENEFFGKPSGLMDQMASSVGGFITIDFKDLKAPEIKAISFDFEKSGYRLCIVDTKGSHHDLTPEYAAIPSEMKSVAEFFAKDCLRQLDKSVILKNYEALRRRCGDRAVLRALHFFDDNERVVKQAQALESGDFDTFLKLVNESGYSSYCYLQNIYANKDPKNQGVSLGLYTAKSVLGDSGACRVHGGGFAGTIQAFVPEEKLGEFISAQENLFGEGACHVLSIRPVGGTEVDLT
ncbi:MAG: galactokinase [Ruminococcus sp.]|nr:galactokinase [Ruminococcus sp.]